MKVSKTILLLLVNLLLIALVKSQESAVQDGTENIEENGSVLEDSPVSEEGTESSESQVNEEMVKDETKEKEAENQEKKSDTEEKEDEPVQAGPFVDLLGPSLLSLKMIDERQATLESHNTNDALSGKSVVGLYFSADWCGPCRQFTPELVQFYDKINSRRGRKDSFEIVWISRCRDMNSFGQYFTHMNWLAMPFQEAAGARGQMLGEKYKVKGIPTLVLLDDMGNVITTDARNQIPKDKAGIGFPWRNPLVSLYLTLVPKPLRLLVKNQIRNLKNEAISKIKMLLPFKSK